MKKHLFITFIFLIPLSFTIMAQSLGDGKPCDAVSTVPDIDGNTYNTIAIGKQCWLKENMKATRFADGTEIKQGGTLSASEAMLYTPGGSADNVETYGYLYNWTAVKHPAASHIGIQGPCPNGWHVPSVEEWTQLENYVSGIGRYVCGDDETNIAKALAANSLWNSSQRECAVGNQLDQNNATVFSALPAGGFNGSYTGYGSTANFWTANGVSNSVTYSYSVILDYSEAKISNSNDNKKYGYSVRCIID